MIRWVMLILLIILIWLQIRLWVGEGSLAHKAELDQQIEQQREENQRLQDRNDEIAKDVTSLKNDLDSIEEKARKDLGMIKKGETFYLVIDEDKKQ